MPLGMYAASVPVYQRQLAAISKELDKGELALIDRHQIGRAHV